METESKSKEREPKTKMSNLNSYKQKMMTNYNPISTYYTGHKENLSKINYNVLNTDASVDESSSKRVNTNSSRDNNNGMVRNSKLQ